MVKFSRAITTSYTMLGLIDEIEVKGSDVVVVKLNMFPYTMRGKVELLVVGNLVVLVLFKVVDPFVVDVVPN
jgi:hypothetical protein